MSLKQKKLNEVSIVFFGLVLPVGITGIFSVRFVGSTPNESQGSSSPGMERIKSLPRWGVFSGIDFRRF